MKSSIEKMISRHEQAFELQATTTKMIPLRRSADNSIYGWRCPECEAFWMVYQNVCHDENCSLRGADR